MQDNKIDFSFGKKLGIAPCIAENIPELLNMISRLLYCMKETNKLHGVECEFFRLYFRKQYFDERFEFPYGCLMLDLKWGSKDELNEKGPQMPQTPEVPKGMNGPLPPR